MKFGTRRRSTPMIGMIALSGALAAQSAAFAQDQAGDVAEDDEPFGEIIVTAERREQSLQDSSLALQVLTAEELDRAARRVRQGTRKGRLRPLVRRLRRRS